ncbi:MAG TPA: helix-turn-helix transcriptional regulator [Candidatus Binatia bacterium]|jgi:ribosome-binding protein aMBF1 (putative translation factor)|nr:helix-turn-helix transcriptional regulator [Candidatus Binatia bacterium]
MARAKAVTQRAITVRPVDKARSMTTSSVSALNQLIRHRREAKGYSLSELARKLGITTESLRDLEDYVDEIDEAPVWLARKLSSLLDIPPEQFFS